MKVTINGKEYEARQGQTVLQAARDNGVYIPSLCYHPKTGPAGKCRVCIVEIEGARGLQTSCTVPVKEGMIINTESENVRKAQRLVVDLLLSSGRHECLAGCNATVVNEVLDFGFRGHDTKVICDDDVPMGSSTCVQCGECVQLCPTGAIVDKLPRGKARTWQLENVETVCPYCGVGCRQELHVDRAANRIVRISGVEDSPVNEGMLCVKGRYAFDFVQSPERLTAPLIREDGGTFRKASWDEALTLGASRFGDVVKKHGPDAVAGLASAKVTNEENFLFQKFMRTRIITNNIDHFARL